MTACSNGQDQFTWFIQLLHALLSIKWNNHWTAFPVEPTPTLYFYLNMSLHRTLISLDVLPLFEFQVMYFYRCCGTVGLKRLPIYKTKSNWRNEIYKLVCTIITYHKTVWSPSYDPISNMNTDKELACHSWHQFYWYGLSLFLIWIRNY